MQHPVAFVPIPPEVYPDYRLQVIFKAYKWDPQVGDTNTIAPGVVVISPEQASWLLKQAEVLAAETQILEDALLRQPKLWSELGLPRPVQRALKGVKGYNPQAHIHLHRFDFHPTQEGWAVSEVNSDVPGGWPEASILPKLAMQFVTGVVPAPGLAETLATALAKKVRPRGRIAYTFATSYADDRQVMQFLADYMEERGFSSIMVSPDHLRWEKGQPHSIARGQEGPVDGIVRFFPGEWLPGLPRASGWQGYFQCSSPSCNHPAALLTQSKRLPLVWDGLGVEIPTWRNLLPETVDPKKVSWREEGWLVKPAFGRVGEDISVRESITDKEWKEISLQVRLFPGEWVAQRRFASWPVSTPGGPMHLCIGVFTVDGKAAGFYGRISSQPRIDSRAMDIPVLIADKEG